ncbi:MAG: sodium-dependent transporter [Ruminococcaceae bacterium]|nr:sodium-dependent transporter [Oscillospiraceae bacterium]
MREKKGFGSNFGFLMAAVGSAIGLGNIWGFPYKMGANGGFTFLVVYLVLGILCGYILLLSEITLGRKTGRGAVATFRIISRRFKWAGWLGVIASFLILGFYSALGGYCIKYVVLNLGNLLGSGFGTNGVVGAEVFRLFMGNQLESVVYGLIFLVITMLIVMGGINGGIERVCKVSMPLLFFMLLVCIIRACTLPGAVEGLQFMFVPGWAVANGVIEQEPSLFAVISAAGGQIFFSLSIGMATMLTYGAYLDKKESLTKNTLLIVVMDTLVALMAGLCVLPARFALDPQGVLDGPEMLFATMQNVFDNMGSVGPVFGILFYLLVVLAALSTSIALFEAVISYFVEKAEERGKHRRPLCALVAALLIGALCVLVCMDGMGNNGIAPYQLLNLAEQGWNGDWLSFFSMVAEGLLMPLGGLLTCLIIGWEVGSDVIRSEVEVTGQHFGTAPLYRLCIRFITPVILLMVLYGQIQSFFFA